MIQVLLSFKLLLIIEIIKTYRIEGSQVSHNGRHIGLPLIFILIGGILHDVTVQVVTVLVLFQTVQNLSPEKYIS